MTEIWRPLPVAGLESDYEISSIGRVRPVRPRNKSWGNYCLKAQIIKGYFVICITRAGNRRYSFKVHRCVALAFLGPGSEEKKLVCHKNDNPLDNRVENLYWGSAKDNSSDQATNNKQVRGERCRISKLTADVVRAIRSEYTQGRISQQELARQHGVGQTAISAVLRRATWAHIN